MLNQVHRQIPVPYNQTGRMYGEAEKALLCDVIDRGTLTRWGGEMVDQLESEWCQKSGLQHTIATSSGTTALHTAIAALEIPPGHHVMTSPVTDIGSILAILQNGLIPIFADIDPKTGMITQQTAKAAWTNKCSAVLFVHLFGRCANLQLLRSLTHTKNAWLIEDASQAHFAQNKGVMSGQFADISAFSLQQSKVVSCGEGGLVCTNSDTLAGKARLFQNKGWLRGQSGNRAYPTLGHNFRMPELSAAVALGQLRKADQIIAKRAEAYTYLSQRLDGHSQWSVNKASKEEVPSWWMLNIQNPYLSPDLIGKIAQKLSAQSLPISHGYIGTEPVFMTDVLAQRIGFGRTNFPWSQDPDLCAPSHADFPGSVTFQRQSMTIPICEGLKAEDTHYIADKILDAIAQAG